MKRIISFTIISILLFSIVALTKNIWDSYRRVSDLNEIREEEKSLVQGTEQLKKELEHRKSKNFIEEEARNKLGLSKPGESIYVVETEPNDSVEDVQAQEEERSNWQHWLKIFKE